MRCSAISLCCFLLAFTSFIRAQSPDQAWNDFRAQILHQRLILHNFSADPSPSFEWTADGLLSTPPRLRTLGVFTLTSGELRRGALFLSGNRSSLVKDDNGKPVLIGHASVTIQSLSTALIPKRSCRS